MTFDQFSAMRWFCLGYCFFLPLTIGAFGLAPQNQKTSVLQRLRQTTGKHHAEQADIEKQTNRRKRKNKYDKFSKVTEKDPLESMIEESGRKNQEILEEKQNKRKLKMHDVPEPPKLAFPDTTTIDPYDPTTFGYIELAKVKSAHGVRGWIKAIASETLEQHEHFLCEPTSVRFLKPANKRAPRQIILLSGRQASGDDYLLSLDGITTREKAQNLRGATLYAREEQQPENAATGDNEYIVADLIGLEVLLQGSEALKFVGKVGGVVFSDDISDVKGLGHDYLEIILPRGVGGTFSLRDELVLIPLVPQLVPYVDVNKGVIHIDPPDGLLDLTYVREEKTRIKGFLPMA